MIDKWWNQQLKPSYVYSAYNCVKLYSWYNVCAVFITVLFFSKTYGLMSFASKVTN